MELERLAAERTEAWSWYSFCYNLAKGDATRMEKVLKMDFRLACTHRAYEMLHKDIADFYTYKKYNMG